MIIQKSDRYQILELILIFHIRLYVRNIYNTKDNDLYKAWIVLITCCSSRCTYLDIVPDCYGHSCINILKRFISVQGAPKLIISDNGPTFSDEVKTFTSSRGITWKPNIQKQDGWEVFSNE